MSADYWVELRRGSQLLGAGFILTKRYVLTALHCLRGLSPGDDEIRIFLPGVSDQDFRGRVAELADEADLALVEVLERLPLVLPVADRCAAGDPWRGPYRPRHSDPYLGGTVACESVKYQCESGSVIEALQLAVREDFGDYSGYSGGPIERMLRNAQGFRGNGAVVGILIEQYPDRQKVERASRTLFAATIAEAFRRFDCLDPEDLIDLLHPEPHGVTNAVAPNSPGRNSHDIETDIASSTRLLEVLREWSENGLLDAPQVPALQARIARNLIDGGRSE